MGGVEKTSGKELFDGGSSGLPVGGSFMIVVAGVSGLTFIGSGVLGLTIIGTEV